MRVEDVTRFVYLSCLMLYLLTRVTAEQQQIQSAAQVRRFYIRLIETLVLQILQRTKRGKRLSDKIYLRLIQRYSESLLAICNRWLRYGQSVGEFSSSITDQSRLYGSDRTFTRDVSKIFRHLWFARLHLSFPSKRKQKTC